MSLLGICDVTSTFRPICKTMATRKPGALGSVFQTQNNNAKQALVGSCALMEMSNRTNNVGPNLFREGNQLHSSVHPSMLFIRVSVPLKHCPPSSLPTHTHTLTPLMCNHRHSSYMEQIQGSPPQQKGWHRWARGWCVCVCVGRGLGLKAWD